MIGERLGWQGGLLRGVWDGVILEALDSCACFRRGDVLSQE